MNRIYRLVFNRALGVMQVASEVACPPRCGTAESSGSRVAALRPVSFALWLALGWVGLALPAAAAQPVPPPQAAGRIVSDPNAPRAQRPTILKAPNGVPVVNITTPSQAGVSRNVYQQFDVGREGAILNNSRGNAQTQLGGWIQGNPWLATGPAKVILNEVNGSDPSRLLGYLEVAGQRAEVVIANPAGILVDGAGFLNASRVTLTTAAPQFNGGALEGYRVGQGAIRVQGEGLDASRADYADLITRSLQVNAGIWANQLQASLGNNLVSADHAGVLARSGGGAVPAFALDVGALGGMYANKIWLVGNEHGVGVRNAGQIGAQAGELVVTVDGRLENSGALQSQQDVQLAASGGITNTGTLSAGRELQLRTGADLDNRGGSLNASRLDVEAGSLRNRGGSLQQTGLQALAVQAAQVLNQDQGSLGALAQDAGGDQGGAGPGGAGGGTPGSGGGTAGDGNGGDTGAGTVLPGSGGTGGVAPLAAGRLVIAGALDNSGGTLLAGGEIDLHSAYLDNRGGSVVVRDLQVDGAGIDNTAGSVSVQRALDLAAEHLDNHDGRLDVAGSLQARLGRLDNQAGQIVHSGTQAATLQVAGTLDNQGGVIASNAAALHLGAGVLVNEDGQLQHAGTDGLTLQAGRLDGRQGSIATAGTLHLEAGQVDHRDATMTAGHIELTAEAFDNRGGTVIASGTQANTVTVHGTLDNGEGGTLASNGGLFLRAATFGNAGGTVQQAGDGLLSIEAATLLGQGGTLLSNGALDIDGGDTDLVGATTSAKRIAIATGNLTTAGGQLIASGEDALQLQVRNAFDNTGGTVATNGALLLQTGKLDNESGTVQAAGSDDTRIEVTGLLDNTGGTVAAAGDTHISAAELRNRGGTVQAADDSTLRMSVDGRLDNSAEGLIASGGDLALDAAVLDNRAGRIQHAGDGTLHIDAAALQGAGGSIASNGALELLGGHVDLRDASTAAQRIAIDAGDLTTAGGQLVATGSDELRLHASDTLDNSGGTIATNGALSLEAGSLANQAGTLQAAGLGITGVHVSNAFDNAGGSLLAAGAMTVDAGSLDNSDGELASASNAGLQLVVEQALANRGGSIAGNGDIHLQAGSLDNREGAIQTQHSIDATLGDTLDNHGGALVAGENLTLHGATVRNGAGPDSGDTGVLSAAQVELHAGLVDNSGGRIEATQGLGIVGQHLLNVGGTLDGSGEVAIEVGDLDNTRGRLIQRGDDGQLSLDVSGAIDNAQGLIGTEGAALIGAGALGNRGGVISAGKALEITTTGTLGNQAGVLQTNGDLALESGAAFDNTNGQVDAAGALGLSAASLLNNAGQILAGTVDDAQAALSLDISGALGNQQGLIGNRGGDVAVHAATVDNAGGTLVAQRDIGLDTGKVSNGGGTLYASGDLRYQNTAATLDNGNGRFGAGGSAWLELAQLGNASGGRVQAGTLWLDAMGINNNGEIGADALHANLVGLTGSGRLYAAQWLDAHYTGNFTLASQELASDGRLDLQVSGKFTNQGTLKSAGELNIQATDVINQGDILASNVAGDGAARIAVTGSIDNRQGASIEADSLDLSADRVLNTGDVSGDAIQITANTLTNGRDLGQALAARDYGEGFIGAADYLELRIARQLSNLDGDIFSGGDLVIAGRTDGSRVQQVSNVSGRIQAAEDLQIDTDALFNQRRVLQTATEVLEGQQQLDDPDATTWTETELPPELVYEVSGMVNCFADCLDLRGQIVHTDRVLERTRVTAASAAGQLLSGGDMRLGTGQLDNLYSTIAAGKNLSISGRSAIDGDDPADWSGVVNNVGFSGYKLIERSSVAYVTFRRCGWNTCASITSDKAVLSTTTVDKDYALADGAATITAGGGLSIVGGAINNTVVRASGGNGDIATAPLGGADSAALGTAVHGQAGTAGAVASQAAGTIGMAGMGTVGDAPQLVGTPEHPLPGLVPADNGMFRHSTDASSPFLVTTAPRFVPGGSSGSEYLLGQLGIDDATHKRLGDAYYEQRLVQEQLLQLTGHNSSDGLAQYRELMDNAAQVAGELGLQLGAALTSTQIEALDHDIVWLVEQEIDGQTVLVPVVYLSHDTAEQLRAGGALMAGENVSLESSASISNDGTLTASEGLWLSADTLINDGHIGAGGTLSIAAAGDTLNRGSIDGGSVQVKAGHDFVQSTTGTLKGTDGVAISAGRDIILEQTALASGGSLVLDAGRDLGIHVSQVQAAGDLVAQAGRNLDVTAQTTQQTRQGPGLNVATQESLQNSSLQAGGSMMLQAGQDLTLQAADVQAGDAMALVAGRDLNLDEVTTTDTRVEDVSAKRHSKHTESLDQTVHGTTLQAGGDLALVAGRDANLTATGVYSEDGGIALSAGRDVNLLAAQEQHDLIIDEQRTKKGFLKRKTTTTHDEWHDSLAIGTTLSGESVQIAAGRDLTAEGAQVAGTGDVLLAAGRDLTLDAAENTHSETHDKTVKKSGLFSGGGIGFTIGKQQLDTTADITDVTHTGSLVGSTEGRVDIVAGRDVGIIGSDVLSQGGIGIVGQNVTIEAVEDGNATLETQKAKQSGIHVGLKGGAVDTAMAVKSSLQRAGEVQDDRLAALHVAQAGQTLFSGGQAGLNSLKGAGGQFGALANTTTDTKATGNNGLSLRIGIGSSSSSSSMEYNASTAIGSRIASDGDVVIHATGDGKGNGGDLSIIGSQVEGDSVTLVAARDLLLQSQQETREQIERNKASSGEIGVTIGSEAGIGVYVSASAAKGKGDGNGTTHAETTVDAANTLTLISGRDTTLEGAQARGETVIADIGRDLTLTSQQDTNDYQRKDQSAGIDAAIGTGGGQISGNYNQSKIDSTYTSVKEQTGLQAGAGGFDITVGGHTQLDGAAIASTADPGRNRLETGSLGWSDLKNEAEYKASSVGFSASGGSGGGSFSPSLSVPQHDKAGSTTQAGIADGTLIVHDGSGEGIARGVTELQQDGLKEIFDQQKVAERMEMGQVAGQVGMRAAGDLAGRMGWEEGSKERAMLHGAVGAAMAALGGGSALEGLTGAAANQMAHKVIYDYLSNELELDPKSGLFASLMQAGSLAVGAAVSGEGGAAVALSATQNNWLRHREAEELKSAEKACSPENTAACQRADELRTLDKARDYDYALYATCPGGCEEVRVGAGQSVRGIVPYAAFGDATAIAAEARRTLVFEVHPFVCLR